MENLNLIYLLNPEDEVVCVLNGVVYDSVSYEERFSDLSTLSFTLDKYVDIDGEYVLSAGYSSIKELMYVYVSNTGRFRIESVSKSTSGTNETMSVSCSSCECELNNQNLISWKINTGEIDSLEYIADGNVDEITGLAKDYITIYNADNPKLSLLNLAIDDVPYWSIGYVDPLVRNKKYTFSIDSQPIYSFLVNELSSTARLVIYFDTKNRLINVYGIDRIDEIGDTNIILNYRNLLNSCEVSKSNDGIYTRFNVAGADNLSVASVNFNENRIENLLNLFNDVDENGNPVYSDTELIDKYKYWYDYRYGENGKRTEWVELTRKYNQSILDISDLENRIAIDNLDYGQLDTFDRETLDILKQTYIDIVNVMVSGFCERDSNGEQVLDNDGFAIINDMDGFKNSIYWEDYKLYINIIIPNVDIAIRNLSIPSDDDKIDYIDTFETDWDLYGTVELNAKLTAYQNKADVLVESGYQYSWESLTADEKARWTETTYKAYHSEYVKVANQMSVCSLAINGTASNGDTLYKDENGYYIVRVNGTQYYYDSDWNRVEISPLRSGTKLVGRQVELDNATAVQDDLYNQRLAMIEDVAIENPKFGLTETELHSIYRLRKDTDYVNENILITSLDDIVSQLDAMEELYQDALVELDIESQPQYSFSIGIDNLFSLSEYSEFVSDFKIAYKIYLSLSDENYIKLRITSISKNPCIKNTNNISLTFSNMLKGKDGLSDWTNLFESAVRSSVNQITSTYQNNIDYSSILLNDNILKALANSSIFSSAMSGIVSDSIISKDGIFDVIQSKFISTDEFEARLARIQRLETDSAFIKYLEANLVIANEIDVDDLYAKLAFIDVAQVGSIFTQSIQATTATIVTSTVDTQFVSDLIAGNITANTLFGSNFVVGSDNSGRIYINGSTMQFQDEDGNVYVQLGTDESGGHSLIISDENGNILLNGSGITENAIVDGLIVDDMIKKKDGTYTGISSDALNVDELGYTTDDNGSLVIRSSQIYFESEKQTLNVKLAEMIQSTTDLGDTLETNYYTKTETPDIVTTIIGSTTMTTTDGSLVNIIDHINSVTDTVDQHTQRFTLVEQGIDEAKQSSSEAIQNVEGFRQTVSETYTTKQELDDLEIGGRNLLISSKTLSESCVVLLDTKP